MKDDDMSNTFIAEVGQKSAIAGSDSMFPEVDIEPPKEEIESLEEEDKNDLEEKLEEKPQKKHYSNKKGHPIITILLMILSLAVGIGGTYYYFKYIEKDTTKEETNKKEREDIKELSPDSTFVTNLINKYDYYRISDSEIFNALYKEDSIKLEDIDEMYLKDITVKNATKDLTPLSITSENFETSATELFGDKIKLTDTDITSSVTKCDFLNYNSVTKLYTPSSNTCNNKTDFSMKRKIVKATEDNDKLEILVAPALLDKESVYKSITDDKATDKIDGLTPEVFDIEKDYSKLNQYKYTFDLDKENVIYRLNKIEIVK